MFKKVILIGLCFILCSCSKKVDFDTGKENLDIVVVTDLHYLAKEYYEECSYFHEAMLYGDGKMTAKSEEILNSFIETMKQRKPDLILISGDLSFNGEKATHENLAKRLKQLTDMGIGVAIINGNHDIENWLATKYTEEDQESVETLDATTFKKIYKNLGFQYAKSKDTHSLSYSFSLNDLYSLIMFDTCNEKLYQGGSGIEKETVLWLEEQLKQISSENKIPLVVMHHNLAKHSELLYSGYTIGNQEEILKLFKQYHVPLVFSGHIHLQNIAEVEGVYDISTASLAISPMQYGVLSLTPDSIDYHTESLDLNIDDEAFFEMTYYNKSYERLLEAFDENTAEKIAKYLSKINRYYFSGQISLHIDEILNDPMYQVVMENESLLDFTATYLKSQTTNVNNDLELHIDIER